MQKPRYILKHNLHPTARFRIIKELKPCVVARQDIPTLSCIDKTARIYSANTLLLLLPFQRLPPLSTRELAAEQRVGVVQQPGDQALVACTSDKTMKMGKKSTAK